MEKVLTAIFLIKLWYMEKMVINGLTRRPRLRRGGLTLPKDTNGHVMGLTIFQPSSVFSALGNEEIYHCGIVSYSHDRCFRNRINYREIIRGKMT